MSKKQSLNSHQRKVGLIFTTITVFTETFDVTSQNWGVILMGSWAHTHQFFSHVGGLVENHNNKKETYWIKDYCSLSSPTRR